MEVMDTNFGGGNEEEKFNMGLALLQRINELFYIYTSYILSGKLLPSSKVLKLICAEVDFCLKPDERDNIEEKLKTIKKYVENNPEIDSTYIIRKSGKIIYNLPNERKQLEEWLDENYCLIRQLMKKHGLLMPQRGESRMF